MRIGVTLALLCSACIALATIRADENAKKPAATEVALDPAKLLGNWSFVSSEKDGTKVEAAAFKEYKVVVTKDAFTLDGATKFVIKYSVDAKTMPSQMAIEISEGPFGVGMKSGGIVKLCGDEMHLCYSPSPSAPPTAFEAKNGARMLVLKRIK